MPDSDRFLLAGVMGWPVMHSRSPVLHNALFAHYRLTGTYVPLAHYGVDPRCRSVMLEIRRDTYMDEESPFHWSEERAQQVTPLLQGMVQAMISWWPHR